MIRRAKYTSDGTLLHRELFLFCVSLVRKCLPPSPPFKCWFVFCQLQVLLDSVHDPFVGIGSNLEIVFLNRPARDLLQAIAAEHHNDVAVSLAVSRNL